MGVLSVFLFIGALACAVFLFFVAACMFWYAGWVGAVFLAVILWIGILVARAVNRDRRRNPY